MPTKDHLRDPQHTMESGKNRPAWEAQRRAEGRLIEERRPQVRGAHGEGTGGQQNGSRRGGAVTHPTEEGRVQGLKGSKSRGGNNHGGARNALGVKVSDGGGGV